MPKKKLNEVYGTKYRISLDQGVFYPRALYNILSFELILASAGEVVKGPDPTKLKYKLKNIELEHETLSNQVLADDAIEAYKSGKEFVYDHVVLDKVVTIKRDTDDEINIKVNAQRRSMKAILLLSLSLTPRAQGIQKNTSSLT